MPRRAAEVRKAMMPIEVRRLFILGIHGQSINCYLGPCRAVYGIPQEGAPKFKAMECESDGKASEARNRNGRTAWQTFGSRAGRSARTPPADDV